MKHHAFFAAILLGIAPLLWLATDTASAQGHRRSAGSALHQPKTATAAGIVLSAQRAIRAGVRGAQGRPATAGKPQTPGKPATAGRPAGVGKPETAGKPSTPGAPGQGHPADAGGKKTPQQLLAQNTRLAERLQNMLPSGTDVMAASQGFKNLGQFVAAVHVSHNLNVPFDQLRTKMVTDGMSLGQAIKALRPDVDAEATARAAAQRAEAEMRGVSTATRPSESGEEASRKKPGV